MSPALEALRRAAAALGDRTRVRLLLELTAGPRRVGELVEAVGASQPLVSHHLAVLAEAGWVIKAGAGKRSAYALVENSAEPVRSLQLLFAAVSAGQIREPLPTIDLEPPRAPGPEPNLIPDGIEDFLL